MDRAGSETRAQHPVTAELCDAAGLFPGWPERSL